MDTSLLLKYLECRVSPEEEQAVREWLANDPDGSHAKKCADEHPGYSVFDGNGAVVYTAKQQFTPYSVQVKIKDLYIRKGPGTNYAKGKFTGIGVFTIVDEADGPGATKWGLLKSYMEKRNGWISLDFATKC